MAKPTVYCTTFPYLELIGEDRGIAVSAKSERSLIQADSDWG